MSPTMSIIFRHLGGGRYEPLTVESESSGCAFKSAVSFSNDADALAFVEGHELKDVLTIATFQMISSGIGVPHGDETQRP